MNSEGMCCHSANIKAMSQDMLDSTQYTIASISDYETVYGENFVSPGGREMACELISKLDLKRGSKVLDVGCGLGGSAFVMAQDFGFLVDGIDLSSNMLALATQKLQVLNLQDKITLSLEDCLNLDRPNYYDAIYSRDVFLHIANKAHLFSGLRSALKQRGKLLFTDYCCGEQPWDAHFSTYVADRGYSLHTLSEYADIVSKAGFSNVSYQDLTERFIEILRIDLDTISKSKFPKATRQKLASGWQAKLDWAICGDHRWGLFSANR